MLARLMWLEWSGLSLDALLTGERNLQEVFSRIRTEKDAEMALKAAELFRRYRASREQHTPFKISTSKMIVQVPCPALSKLLFHPQHPDTTTASAMRKAFFTESCLESDRRLMHPEASQRELKALSLHPCNFEACLAMYSSGFQTWASMPCNQVDIVATALTPPPPR